LPELAGAIVPSELDPEERLSLATGRQRGGVRPFFRERNEAVTRSILALDLIRLKTSHFA